MLIKSCIWKKNSVEKIYPTFNLPILRNELKNVVIICVRTDQAMPLILSFDLSALFFILLHCSLESPTNHKIFAKWKFLLSSKPIGTVSSLDNFNGRAGRVSFRRVIEKKKKRQIIIAIGSSSCHWSSKLSLP